MPTSKPGEAPFTAVADAFCKLWSALASIPPEACGNPQHSAWNEPFLRSGPLVAEFDAAASQARCFAGVLAPVAEAQIQAAEMLVAELIGRLNSRNRDRLPGLLAMEWIRVTDALRNLAAMTATMPANAAPPNGTQQAEGGTPPPANRPRRDPNQPSRDRQDDIIAALHAAGMPLTRPELIDAMKLKTEGKLGANLAWMVANDILVNVPHRSYWPANVPAPE